MASDEKSQANEVLQTNMRRRGKVVTLSTNRVLSLHCSRICRLKKRSSNWMWTPFRWKGRRRNKKEKNEDDRLYRVALIKSVVRTGIFGIAEIIIGIRVVFIRLMRHLKQERERDEENAFVINQFERWSRANDKKKRFSIGERSACVKPLWSILIFSNE